MSAEIIDLRERRSRSPEPEAADAAWTEFVVALTQAQQLPTLANMRVAVAAADVMEAEMDRVCRPTRGHS